jgi:hypothetical protein
MPSNTDDTSRAGVTAPNDPPPAYETRDASTKGVLGFLVVLFVVINLILLGTWRLFRHFSVADLPPASASPFANVRQVPSSPELQVNAREDFLKMYAQQQQELSNYAWEDREAGTVRIPIDRAMDLLLQKGLPVLPSAGASQATASAAALQNRLKQPNQASAAPQGSLARVEPGVEQ